MDEKDFLSEKYCEINYLKSMLETYPIQYKETIVKVIATVLEEVSDYIESKRCDGIKHNDREQVRRFTMAEIALCDGKEGREAYIVIEGTVYDVKESKAWSMGKHYGLSAGKDLTRYFNNCHESQKHYLKKLRIVGTIIE